MSEASAGSREIGVGLLGYGFMGRVTELLRRLADVESPPPLVEARGSPGETRGGRAGRAPAATSTRRRAGATDRRRADQLFVNGG
jgi:hypothetical protein